MSEQVIDIRDRIEKMRNQMTGEPGSSKKIEEKKNSNKGSKSSIPEVEVKNIENKNNLSEMKTKNPKKNSSSPISHLDHYITEKTNSNSSHTTSSKSFNEYEYDFRKDKRSEGQKTYEDYHSDKTFDAQKKAVKFDESQPFPQFSLNVSNPISWKLMLLIMLMQLLTNIMLVIVLYLK